MYSTFCPAVFEILSNTYLSGNVNLVPVNYGKAAVLVSM